MEEGHALARDCTRICVAYLYNLQLFYLSYVRTTDLFTSSLLLIESPAQDAANRPTTHVSSIAGVIW